MSSNVTCQQSTEIGTVRAGGAWRTGLAYVRGGGYGVRQAFARAGGAWKGTSGQQDSFLLERMWKDAKTNALIKRLEPTVGRDIYVGRSVAWVPSEMDPRQEASHRTVNVP